MTLLKQIRIRVKPSDSPWIDFTRPSALACDSARLSDDQGEPGACRRGLVAIEEDPVNLEVGSEVHSEDCPNPRSKLSSEARRREIAPARSRLGSKLALWASQRLVTPYGARSDGVCSGPARQEGRGC